MAAFGDDGVPGRSPAGRPAPSAFVASLRSGLAFSLGAAAIVGVAFFMFRTRVSMTLTLGAAMAAVALSHVVEALVRRGLARRWATAAVVGGLVAVLALAAFFLIPSVVAQGRDLLAAAPRIWQQVRHHEAFVALDGVFGIEEQVRSQTRSPGAAVGLIQLVVGVATGLVALLFLAILMLVFGRRLLDALLVHVPATPRARMVRIGANIYTSVGGYSLGLLAICAINTALTTAFLAIVGVPYFLPLGILGGMSSLVPYAGPLASGTLITLMAASQGSLLHGLATAIYFVVYGQIEGNVLAPLMYRRTVHVSPLVTLLAVLFMAEFMGPAGAVVAVPAAAAAQILVREFLAARREAARTAPLALAIALRAGERVGPP